MSEKRVDRRELISGLVGRGSVGGAMTTRVDAHGRKVSLLGYGAMRLPTIDGGHANGWAKSGYSESGIDQKLLDSQVRYMLERGINYFDTSPAYCRGDSEASLGRALRASGYARSDYMVATKLSNFAPQQYPLERCKEMFENSLRFLQTDYIDYYLLHSIGNGGFETFSKRYLENGALDWCLRLREEGRVRNLGFSFHGDKKAFDWCVERHDKYRWDFCQIQMNYVDWHHAKEVNDRNLDAEYLYRALDAKGIPIVVMEPLLGGRLARFNYAVSSRLRALDPDASMASWAFRFCGTYPRVLTILSGMTYTKFIEENLATFSPLKPLSRRELDTLEEAARLLLQNKTVPCNLCQYCMPCPYGIDIPGNFDCWNRACTEDRLPDGSGGARHAADRRRFLADYDRAIPHLRQAEHCIGCGRCVSHCPQHIDIPERLADIDEFVAGLRKEERHA